MVMERTENGEVSCLVTSPQWC